MSLARAVVYTARKILADAKDLGLTASQHNVVVGYADMLQAIALASGWVEGSGDLSNWAKDRHQGLWKDDDAGTRKISLPEEKP